MMETLFRRMVVTTPMQPEIFDRLVRTLMARVSRRARRFVHDRNRVPDITQEVFLALWRHWPSIESESHAYAWLMTAARDRARRQP